MRKNLTLSFILLFVTFISSAQFSLTSQKEANKIKTSVLIVALEEASQKTIDKLSKKDPEALEHYKDQITGRNFALETAVKDYWTFSKEIKYMPLSEAEGLVKQNKDNHVLLKFGTILEYEKFRTGVGTDGKPAGWSRTNPAGSGSQSVMYYNPSTKYTELSNEITTLEIHDAKSLIRVYLPKVYPSLADAVYGVQEVQFILTYLTSSPENKLTKLPKYIKDQAPDLENLTLLVDKDEVHKKVNDESVQSVYPYEFEMVSQETIDNAILERDEKYAFVNIVPIPGGKGNLFAHTIMRAKDGTLYGYFMPKMAVGIKGSSIIQYNERIKLKNFERYAKHVTE